MPVRMSILFMNIDVNACMYLYTVYMHSMILNQSPQYVCPALMWLSALCVFALHTALQASSLSRLMGMNS